MQNPQFTQGVVNRAYVEATLTTALNFRQRLMTDNQDSEQFRQYVYKLKKHEVGNYFDLVVAGERMSSVSVLYNIAKHTCPKGDGVHLPWHLVNNLKNHEPGMRELIARCLLQTILFYKHVVNTEEIEESDLK